MTVDNPSVTVANFGDKGVEILSSSTPPVMRRRFSVNIYQPDTIQVNCRDTEWGTIGPYRELAEPLPLSPLVVADPLDVNSAKRRYRATSAILSTRSTLSRSVRRVRAADSTQPSSNSGARSAPSVSSVQALSPGRSSQVWSKRWQK